MKVYVPSPLSSAIGPALGSQSQLGPVNLSSWSWGLHTVVVIVNTSADASTFKTTVGKKELIPEKSLPRAIFNKVTSPL